MDTDYYFDIETALKDPKSDEKAVDPNTAKIITIQYQRLDTQTGEPVEDLTVLKEWEDGNSEKKILEEFKPLITGWIFDFIPLGFGLKFEFKFLNNKLKEHFDQHFPAEAWIERPKNDLRMIGAILNNGIFKGASLDSFTDKEGNGKLVPTWYKDERYDEILNYVKNEAKATTDLWQKLKKLLLENFPN